MEKEKYISVNETAAILKVSVQYVRKLIKLNELEAITDGKRWVTTKENIDKYITDKHIIIEPDDHERKTDGIPEIVALSFFSGAMGLDLGMKNAGIKALLACEFNKYCRTTIEKNNPDIALIGDITKYDKKTILKMAKIPETRKVDIIFGGPPCQAFSTAGAGKAFDDERGNVFLKYLDVIGEIKPTYAVIENVRGLLSASYPYKNISEPFKGGALLIILDKLREYGYTISFNLYNSANFGSPQNRERIVLIAKLGKNKVQYLSPTHSNNIEDGLLPWRTLKDALNKCNPKTHNYIDFPEKRLKYYKVLKEGQNWKDLPENLQKEAMGAKLQLSGGKTGFFRRLSYSKPAPTLVTNPAMPATDLCHPVENRPLSIEEYKAIQEFPNTWEIYGPVLEQYKQIGNAVPIKLGEAIGKRIIKDMKGIKDNLCTSFKYSRYTLTDEISWENKTRKKYHELLKKQNQVIIQD